MTAQPKALKLGRYTYERRDKGFTVYSEVKDFYNLDGSPWREEAYRLTFHRMGGKLYWSLYSCKRFRTLDGDEAPNTIARFAHDVCTDRTIFSFSGVKEDA